MALRKQKILLARVGLVSQIIMYELVLASMHKYELVLRILCLRARSLFHAYDTPTYGLVNYNIYIYIYIYYESSLLARSIILL